MRVRLGLLCVVVVGTIGFGLLGWGGRPRSRSRSDDRVEESGFARIVPASFRSAAAGEAGDELEAVSELASTPAEATGSADADARSKAATEVHDEKKAKKKKDSDDSSGAAAHEAARAKFFLGKIPRISIHIAADAERSLDADPRSYASCTVVADGVTHETVGIHLKGAAGSFRALRNRPGLTLNFKRFPEGKLFHGMRKIHLNNSVQDPSLLSEIICSEMFLACGVPSARATHARVELNGKDMGLYVLVEGMDRAFLDHHFQDHAGALYDGGFCQDIHGSLHQLSGSKTGPRGGIQDLIRAASEADPERRWTRIGEVLDVERFITYIAIEVMIWDWDGYVLKPNNYRLYHGAQSRRMTFLPHGMDQMFQQTDGSILQGMAGWLARAVIECPEGKEKYLQRMLEIFPRVFAMAEISERIRALVERGAEALEDRPPLAARLRAAGESLRRRIEARARNVESQLRRRPRPLEFDAAGRASAATADWSPRIDSGGPIVEEPRAGEARRTLGIRVTREGTPTVASWRWTVTLPRGRYRFEGRARTSGVVALADKKGEGAGIRTSGTKTPRTNALTGDSAWTDLSYDFEVAGSRGDVTLLAELRATAGAAEFDLESMRISRVR